MPIHITGLQEISLPATAVQTQLSSTAAFFGCGSNLSCQKTPCDTTQSLRLGFPQLLGWLQSSRSHSFALYHPPFMHRHHPPSTYYINLYQTTVVNCRHCTVTAPTSGFVGLFGARLARSSRRQDTSAFNAFTEFSSRAHAEPIRTSLGHWL